MINVSNKTYSKASFPAFSVAFSHLSVETSKSSSLQLDKQYSNQSLKKNSPYE